VTIFVSFDFERSAAFLEGVFTLYLFITTATNLFLLSNRFKGELQNCPLGRIPLPRMLLSTLAGWTQAAISIPQKANSRTSVPTRG
jgi:hypothetical protein